jgi:hypothetical protein
MGSEENKAQPILDDFKKVGYFSYSDVYKRPYLFMTQSEIDRMTKTYGENCGFDKIVKIMPIKPIE